MLDHRVIRRDKDGIYSALVLRRLSHCFDLIAKPKFELPRIRALYDPADADDSDSDSDGDM